MNSEEKKLEKRTDQDTQQAETENLLEKKITKAVYIDPGLAASSLNEKLFQCF